MAKKVLILLGTKKGAFILKSDADRRSWVQSGPFCETWPLNHVNADPATGTIYGGGGNEWFGPAVWKSTDLGASWSHSSEGLAYQEGEEPIKSVWSVAPGGASLYAGVEPAGLFRSDDGENPGGTSPACATTPRGRTGIRAAPGSFCTPWCRTRMTKDGSGSGSPAPACFIPPTAAPAGSPATAAPGPTTCPKSRDTRSTASACTAW